MNYLQLCQEVAAESGTISGSGQPASVLNQTGRLAHVVRWVRVSYRSIQNAHADWLWLQATFHCDAIPNQQAHSGSDLKLTSFSDFRCRKNGSEDRFSIYDPSAGLNEEGSLRWMDWDRFFITQMRGPRSIETGKPEIFTIGPDGKLYLSPTPDKAYKLRGLYRKGIQALAANEDTPDMPERFHDVIVEAALKRLNTFDEAYDHMTLMQLRELKGFAELEHNQLPPIRLNGPLA